MNIQTWARSMLHLFWETPYQHFLISHWPIISVVPQQAVYLNMTPSLLQHFATTTPACTCLVWVYNGSVVRWGGVSALHSLVRHGMLLVEFVEHFREDSSVPSRNVYHLLRWIVLNNDESVPEYNHMVKILCTGMLFMISLFLFFHFHHLFFVCFVFKGGLTAGCRVRGRKQQRTNTFPH